MESLKEKNKKQARRFGMSKKSLVGLALGTVGLMGLVYNYSNVQAGSLTAPSGGPYQPKSVAKELVEANNVTVQKTDIPFNNSTHKYTPSLSGGGALSNFRITVSVDNAEFNIGSQRVAICKSADNDTIATLDSGISGWTNTLVFQGESSKSLSHGVNYYIGNSTCNGTADLNIKVLRGALSVTLTIKAIDGANNQVVDTASAQIISVVPQFAASIASKLSKQIDYASAFKTFENNTTSDSGSINLNATSLDVRVSDTNSTTFSVTLKPTDMSGFSNVTIKREPSGSAGNCTKLTDRFVCNATGDVQDVSNKAYTINATVTGTDVLAERSFKVDALLDFADTNVADQTFFTNADFGKWTYKGTTIYVPIIGHAPEQGRFTTIRLQTKDTNLTAIKVRALILASDGSLVAADLGQITPGTPFTITGGQLKDKVVDAGRTVGDTFAAILIVATAEENLFAYAVMDHQGVSRRVPLKVKDGKIVE
jgi:hypothetical protein